MKSVRFFACPIFWAEVSGHVLPVYIVTAEKREPFRSGVWQIARAPEIAELQYRLSLRDTPRRQRIARLNWEVNNRTRWNEDVAHGSPHAAAIPLSDNEVEARRHELQQLTRNSFAWRAFTYFLGCLACQPFWTAIAIYALTRGVTDPAGWFFSAAAYSGAAVLLSVAHGCAPSSESNRQG